MIMPPQTTPVTIKNLEKAGYKRHSHPLHKDDPNYVALYQKCFRGPGGNKSYFIDINVWNMEKLGEEHQKWFIDGLSYSPHAQFNTKDGQTFNIEFLANIDTTLEKVEDFFYSVFKNMDCRDYD